MAKTKSVKARKKEFELDKLSPDVAQRVLQALVERLPDFEVFGCRVGWSRNQDFTSGVFVRGDRGSLKWCQRRRGFFAVWPDLARLYGA